MNAAGLNLLKLDHVRNSAQVQERQRHECGRPLWHFGLYLYIGSQLAGSTTALNFLKAQWVAPLGSIALIFNFVFAKILVGTRITRQDVLGTIVVMLSVIWIVVFGGMNSGADIEATLTLKELKELFSRFIFIVYFSVFDMVVFSLLALGLYAYWAISLDDASSGQIRKDTKIKLTRLLTTNQFSRESRFRTAAVAAATARAEEQQWGNENRDDGENRRSRDLETDEVNKDLRLKKVVAMIMSIVGGLMASQTLLLAKSGIKLITSTASGNNQFQDPLSFFILFILVFTAVVQVYCLNTALKLYDSVLVVPMFYGFYTAFGLINSTIYLDQLQNYQTWVLLLIFVGIAALIYGVHMLSAPKPDLDPADIDGVTADTERTSRDAEYQGGDDDQDNEIRSKEAGRGPKSGSRVSLVGAEWTGHVNDSLATVGNRKLSSLRMNSKIGLIGRRDTIVDTQNGDMFEGLQMSPSILADNRPRRDEAVERADTGPEDASQNRSLPWPSPALKTNVSVYEKRSSVNQGREGRNSLNERKRTPLRINTDMMTITRGRSETRRDSASRRLTSPAPRPMSPSEFRAQYTDSPFPIKPKHLQGGALGLSGSISSSWSTPPVSRNDSTGANARPSSVQPRDGRSSPRWVAGSARMGQVLEDLNPLNVFRRNSVDCSLARSSRNRTSTGLPSEWDGPNNRKWKHNMLFDERRWRSSSVGRSASMSAPPVATQFYSPVYSRCQSAGDVVNGIWSTGGGDINRKAGEPLSPASISASHHRQQDDRAHGDSSPQEPQSYRNHYFTGTPPPLSATSGGGGGNGSSVSSISHYRRPSTSYSGGVPSISHGQQQLSFTTKNDHGGSSGVALTAKKTDLALSTGTFGVTNNSTATLANESDTTPTTTSPTTINSGMAPLPMDVQQQLQQLQQHQHHPTSQLQYSMTTSSISTIGSNMPSTSTSVSLAQLANEPRSTTVSASSTSNYLWMGMTPSQSMQAVELDMQELDMQELDLELFIPETTFQRR
ncbi:hypothetical protein BGZ51_008119 [Haplosporangium sp. Z 767]|nr:hypothetical protein BGZ51_008119 [Haplosporangium sp. Z 767]KAF9179372.1 hypothetical protein BGZ50_006970 [Haplosporangium sp. Z 11]